MRDKRGKKEVKSGRFNFRMSQEDADMLRFIRDRTGESLSDIFRNGLKMQYNLERLRAGDFEDEEENLVENYEEDEYDF